MVSQNNRYVPLYHIILLLQVMNDRELHIPAKQNISAVMAELSQCSWLFPGKRNSQFYRDSWVSNKHLVTGPKRNNESCFPETFNVSWGKAKGNIEVEEKQNSLFPAGPVIKCFVIPPNSKLEKTVKKLSALCWLARKFAAVSRATTWSCASWEFLLLFP